MITPLLALLAACGVVHALNHRRLAKLAGDVRATWRARRTLPNGKRLTHHMGETI